MLYDAQVHNSFFATYTIVEDISMNYVYEVMNKNKQNHLKNFIVHYTKLRFAPPTTRDRQ